MSAKKDLPFLLEIGYEELPFEAQKVLRAKASFLFAQYLKSENIPFDNLLVYVTPRRLVLFSEGIAVRQPSYLVKIQGPKKDIAFDARGNPTSACLGFLRKYGAKMQELKIEDTAKGSYVYLTKKKAGKASSTILKDIIPVWLSSLPFPKTMRWDDSQFKFARPIRWVLTYIGDKNLKVKIAKVKSANYTMIRQGAYFQRLIVKSANDYFQKIKKKGIILSFDQRQIYISKIITNKANQLGCKPHIDCQLLEEVTSLCESPYAIIGEFNKDFLKLPQEVLLASMSKYQRIFAVKRNNRLVNKFIAILDGCPRNVRRVCKHYEYVLNARLWDASYFYGKDLNMSWEDRIKLLSSLTLEERLGTLQEKVVVMREVAEQLAEILNLDAEIRQYFIRAVELSKADLVSLMVKEFPSLQGIMGGIYAAKSGEAAEVAAAIYEHYQPKTPEDELPRSKLGCLLSVLDKAYNIIGLLGVNITPSGSHDPYGIRRQMHAMMRILSYKRFGISLDLLFSLLYGKLKDKLLVKEEKLKELFFNIARDRFYHIMSDGIAGDLLRACIDVNFQVPFEVYLRMRQLMRIYNKKSFLKAAKVVERTYNILKGFKSRKGVEEKLFEYDEEKELWSCYLSNKDAIEELIAQRQYDKATIKYGEVFYDILHRFFDRVMVNVENMELRNNRKELLWRINKLYTEKVANLQEMEVLKDGNAGKIS